MLTNRRLDTITNANQCFPKIGFSTNVLNHPGNELVDPSRVVESLRVLSQWFTCVELELSEAAEDAVLKIDPTQYSQLVDGVCETAEKQALAVTLHATWFGQSTNLADREADVSAASLDLLKRNIDFASAIGARTVTCHPGYHQDQSRSAIQETLRRYLGVAVEYARSKNVTLCLENMGDDRPNYIVLDVVEQQRLCKDTGVRVAMDLIHLRSLYGDEADYKAALEELAPYVSNAHIADMNGRRHNHLPIGDGDFALTESLNILGKHGYSGGAVVEEWVRNRPFDVYLDRAKSYREFIEGMGLRAAQ